MVVLTEARKTLACMHARISFLERELETITPHSLYLEDLTHALLSTTKCLRLEWETLSKIIADLESELSNHSADSFERDINS